jgi:hypothetical protein
MVAEGPVAPTYTLVESSLTKDAWRLPRKNKCLTATIHGSSLLLPLPLGNIVMRRLRLSMWSSAILAIVLQAAFLFELHSPQAMDEMLWSLFVASVVCSIMFVYARSALSSLKRYKS